MELLANDVISKPCTMSLLRKRVANVAPKYIQDVDARLERSYDDLIKLSQASGLTKEEKVHLYIKAQEPHFDLVRLVNPKDTIIFETNENMSCNHEFCYSVWGKQLRCSNCISLQALEKKGRFTKLEYSQNALHFVISEYVPYGDTGAVVEMVTRLANEYVDNVFDKSMLYLNLDDLHNQISLDPLTGIYNRRHVDANLKNYISIARAKRRNMGIAMIDIDFFKNLNDTKGHLVGDLVLKGIATVLHNNIAVSRGDFVARFGGDEFIVVSQDIPAEVFNQRMKVMAELVGHLSFDELESEKISISVGCVNISEHDLLTVTELLELADKRLYEAKSRGKNCVVSE